MYEAGVPITTGVIKPKIEKLFPVMLKVFTIVVISKSLVICLNELN